MEQETNEFIRKKVLPKLALLGVVYVLLAASIALFSYLAVIISGKGNTAENISLFHNWITYFFKSVSGSSESKFLFPGPGDFFLAAVVLLYRKRWKISAGVLVIGAIMYVYGQFLIEPPANAIHRLSLSSPAGLVLECLFSAFTSLFVLSIAFLPAAAAVVEKCRWKIILPCNLLFFWAQPLWILMMFFAFKKAVVITRETQVKTKAAVSSKRLWEQVHERRSKKRKDSQK